MCLLLQHNITEVPNLLLQTIFYIKKEKILILREDDYIKLSAYCVNVSHATMFKQNRQISDRTGTYMVRQKLCSCKTIQTSKQNTKELIAWKKVSH